MELLKSLYGAEFLNSMLAIIFEFLSYLLIGLLGSVTREIFIEKKKKLPRIIGSSLLTAIVLFATSSYLVSKFPGYRVVFGVGVLLGFYIPSFINSITSGKVVKSIAKVVAPQLHKLIHDIEEDSNKP